jgi:hypothetical protein
MKDAVIAGVHQPGQQPAKAAQEPGEDGVQGYDWDYECLLMALM